jgi:hypothetical protein
MIPMEPGSLVMERKLLYGIKKRPEELARDNGRALVPRLERMEEEATRD